VLTVKLSSLTRPEGVGKFSQLSCVRTPVVVTVRFPPLWVVTLTGKRPFTGRSGGLSRDVVSGGKNRVQHEVIACLSGQRVKIKLRAGNG